MCASFTTFATFAISRRIISPTSPAEFGEMIRREMAKVAKVVKDAHIRVD